MRVLVFSKSINASIVSTSSLSVTITREVTGYEARWQVETMIYVLEASNHSRARTSSCHIIKIIREWCGSPVIILAIVNKRLCLACAEENGAAFQVAC